MKLDLSETDVGALQFALDATWDAGSVRDNKTGAALLNLQSSMNRQLKALQASGQLKPPPPEPKPEENKNKDKKQRKMAR